MASTAGLLMRTPTERGGIERGLVFEVDKNADVGRRIRRESLGQGLAP
jgi:hypothetical protein